MLPNQNATKLAVPTGAMAPQLLDPNFKKRVNSDPDRAFDELMRTNPAAKKAIDDAVKTGVSPDTLKAWMLKKSAQTNPNQRKQELTKVATTLNLSSYQQVLDRGYNKLAHMCEAVELSGDTSTLPEIKKLQDQLTSFEDKVSKLEQHVNEVSSRVSEGEASSADPVAQEVAAGTDDGIVPGESDEDVQRITAKMSDQPPGPVVADDDVMSPDAQLAQECVEIFVGSYGGIDMMAEAANNLNPMIRYCGLVEEKRKLPDALKKFMKKKGKPDFSKDEDDDGTPDAFDKDSKPAFLKGGKKGGKKANPFAESTNARHKYTEAWARGEEEMYDKTNTNGMNCPKCGPLNSGILSSGDCPKCPRCKRLLK
jgi:rubrerythrin